MLLRRSVGHPPRCCGTPVTLRCSQRGTHQRTWLQALSSLPPACSHPGISEGQPLASGVPSVAQWMGFFASQYPLPSSTSPDASESLGSSLFPMEVLRWAARCWATSAHEALVHRHVRDALSPSSSSTSPSALDEAASLAPLLPDSYGLRHLPVGQLVVLWSVQSALTRLRARCEETEVRAVTGLSTLPLPVVQEELCRWLRADCLPLLAFFTQTPEEAAARGPIELSSSSLKNSWELTPLITYPEAWHLVLHTTVFLVAINLECVAIEGLAHYASKVMIQEMVQVLQWIQERYKTEKLSVGQQESSSPMDVMTQQLRTLQAHHSITKTVSTKPLNLLLQTLEAYVTGNENHANLNDCVVYGRALEPYAGPIRDAVEAPGQPFHGRRQPARSTEPTEAQLAAINAQLNRIALEGSRPSS